MSASEAGPNWHAEERRDSERHPVLFDLLLTDLTQKTPLGEVIDISLSGMRIVSETPFPVDVRRFVRLDIILEDDHPHTVCFATHCVWSRYVERLGCYEAGCANMLSAPVAVCIAQLIARLREMMAPALQCEEWRETKDDPAALISKQDQAMNGRKLLRYLLQEMHRDATSGHLYYTVQSGWNGKIIVDQGQIKSVTYRGVPLGASELGALKFRKAVVVPGLRLSSTLLISQKPPDMAAVLKALEAAEASAEEASGVSTKRAAPEV